MGVDSLARRLRAWVSRKRRRKMKDGPTVNEEKLLRLFSRFDANSDGLVDESEFRTIVESLGEIPSNEVLSLEFAAIDTNADGRVEFNEFKAWWLDYE
jgi:calmodulin